MIMTIDYNRLGVIRNEYQGPSKRVLCVCSGGVLRSPTAALVLSRAPFEHNTRSAGTEDYALIRVDEALIHWADRIVCMTQEHANKVKQLADRHEIATNAIVVLEILDNFAYCDGGLVNLITTRYSAWLKEHV